MNSNVVAWISLIELQIIHINHSQFFAINKNDILGFVLYLVTGGSSELPVMLMTRRIFLFLEINGLMNRTEQ